MTFDKLFNFFIFENGRLVYSKYSFDFLNYAKDYNITTDSKYEIFNHFYINNESTLDKPTSIKNEYKKYFKYIPLQSPIIIYLKKYGILHTSWLNYINIDQDIEYFESNQFDLITYSDEVCIQDFIYYTSDNKILSKYNFDFATYSKDWNIPILSKNFVFTDFIFRNIKLSKEQKYVNTSVYNLNDGYVVLPEFVKYFYSLTTKEEKESLYNYLAYQAVSNNSASDKYLSNIDFAKYVENNTITKTLDIYAAKEHFMENGQFECRKITFNILHDEPINDLKQIIGTIYSNSTLDNKIGSGFLFSNNDDNLYFITSYNLMKDLNSQNFIYVIFENNVKNSVVQFTIIGFDEITNVLVSKLDFETQFNLTNVPNINDINIKINNSYIPSFSETLYLCANLNSCNDVLIVPSTLINSSYSDNLAKINQLQTDEIKPESLLLKSDIDNPLYGSPVFKNNCGKWEIVAMITNISNDQYLTKYVSAIKNTILLNVIYQIIKKWNTLQFNTLQFNTLQTEIGNQNNIIINGFQRSWLGIINEYNHPNLAKKYCELSTLSYIGGLVVTNVILGFNLKTNKFVFSPNELFNFNVVELKSPLIFSKLYQRLIKNDNIPIVIKTIYFRDNLKSEYCRCNIGKFGSQELYTKFIYGNQPISLTQTIDPTIYNKFTPFYSNIIIDYFYYDDNHWILDSETIGGNCDKWFIDYKDNIQNIYRQHLFEYPQILTTFHKQNSLITFRNKKITPYLFINRNRNEIIENIEYEDSVSSCDLNDDISEISDIPFDDNDNESNDENNSDINNESTQSLIDLFDPFNKAVLSIHSNEKLIINRPIELLSDLIYKGKTLENILSSGSFNGGTIDKTALDLKADKTELALKADKTALDLKAPLNSPIFSGNTRFNTIPIIICQLEPTFDNQLVTLKFVNDRISDITNIDPEMLETLNNILQQLHSGTDINIINSKAPKLNPIFNGEAIFIDNVTINGSFVVNGDATFNDAFFNGLIFAKTLPINTNNDQVATTKYVTNQINSQLNHQIVSQINDLMTNGIVIYDIKKAIQNLTQTKAPINSPSFEGIPTAPLPIYPYNENQLVTVGFVNNQINSCLNNSTINNPTINNSTINNPTINNPTITGSITGIKLSDIDIDIDIDVISLANTKADKNNGIINFTTINKPLINNPTISDVTFTNNVTGLKKSNVGLSKVDNTSDLNKPISDAVKIALNEKVNKKDIVNPIFKDVVVNNVYVNSNIDNRKDIEFLNATYNIDDIKPITYINKTTEKQEIGIDTSNITNSSPFLLNENNNSINYVGLIGLLINEIQELKKTVNELKQNQQNH